MPGVARILDFCWGVDVSKGIESGGLIMGPGAPNVLVEGRSASTATDFCIANTGAVGNIVTMPRNILIEGRTIACQFDFIVGQYQGFIITGAATVMTSL